MLHNKYFHVLQFVEHYIYKLERYFKRLSSEIDEYVLEEHNRLEESFAGYAYSSRQDKYYVAHTYGDMLLFHSCPKEDVYEPLLRDFPNLDDCIEKNVWVSPCISISWDKNYDFS